MAVLYKLSDSGHITQNSYNSFLMDFERAASQAQPAANTSIPAKLKAISAILNEMNDVAYNIDGNRDVIYHFASPIYKAVTENWGDEVVNMAIANAYFMLREYVVYISSDVKLRTAINVINNHPVVFGTNSPSCDYTVWLGSKASKDKIDIYFSNIGLYYKAAKKYPDMLLAGPIMGWENYKDESESVMNILNTYTDMNDNSAYHMQSNENKTGKPVKLTRDLNSDMKWFMWVFRNNKLYYSYMVEPCSPISQAQIK